MSQHRLQFYSKADVRKVLKGVEPHLRLKKNQLNNVLDTLTPHERQSPKSLHNWLKNWSNTIIGPTKKGDELLSEWGVKDEDIMTWRDPTLMQLGIEAERLEALL